MQMHIKNQNINENKEKKYNDTSEKFPNDYLENEEEYSLPKPLLQGRNIFDLKVKKDKSS